VQSGEKKSLAFETHSGELLVRVNERVYEKEAVMAATYKFTDRCVIQVEPVEEQHLLVRFLPKDGDRTSDLEAIVADFRNEIADQQVRLDLDRRYGSLRDTIVQHAFEPLGPRTAQKKTK
jgi:His-Xaa-Ser system protein HxsD